MPQNINIVLEEVNSTDLPLFTKKLQKSFSIAVMEKFGTSTPIPSEKEIYSSFHAKGAASYHLVLNGQRIGGVILVINEQTQHNSLDLFFISPEHHNRGLGVAAWKAIEEKYPDTVVWETKTPYFEERNIHFYVNKCGFHIVEFFNQHHLDPNTPHPENHTGKPVPGIDTYFRFEKVMK